MAAFSASVLVLLAVPAALVALLAVLIRKEVRRGRGPGVDVPGRGPLASMRGGG